MWEFVIVTCMRVRDCDVWMSYESIESDDGVERGAQFVTDVCQEPAVCCRCVNSVLQCVVELGGMRSS